MKEVKVAIKTMQSWKAAGADGVTPEMLKAEGDLAPFDVHLQRDKGEQNDS